MKSILNHIKNYWEIYTIAITLVIIIGINILIPRLITVLEIDSTVVNSISLIILLWFEANLIGIIRMNEKIRNKLFNLKWKRLILILVNTAAIGLIVYEMLQLDTTHIAESVIAFFFGYGGAILLFRLFKYLKSLILQRREYVTVKQWKRINAYMEKNNHIVIGNVNINELYCIKINFPARNTDQIMDFFKFFISNPNTSFMISKIFREHIKLDENHNMYINNKLETNPSKVGLFIMNQLRMYSKAEHIVQVEQLDE